MKKKVVEISPVNEKIKTNSGIQVIARAAAVLRTLRDAPDGMSLAEIAKALELPRSTIQRIVEALDHENLVIAASPLRGVRLGPALLTLAAAARFEITEIARETLQFIARDCGETVALAVCNGVKIIFVDQVSSTHDLRVEPPIGNSLPMHSTAPGKAILAAMDQHALEKLRPRLNFVQITPYSITSWADMDKELAEIRKRGVAFDLEEMSLGISAAAVSLALPNEEYAAISIPVPTQRFAEQKSKLVEVLKTHSAKLQKRLSGTRRL